MSQEIANRLFNLGKVDCATREEYHEIVKPAINKFISMALAKGDERRVEFAIIELARLQDIFGQEMKEEHYNFIQEHNYE